MHLESESLEVREVNCFLVVGQGGLAYVWGSDFAFKPSAKEFVFRDKHAHGPYLVFLTEDVSVRTNLKHMR